MHSFMVLLKREWLEHRAAFTIAPIVVLVVLLIAAMTAGGISNGLRFTFGEDSHPEIYEVIGDSEVSGLEAAAAVALDPAGSTDAELAAKLDMLLYGIAQPFHLVVLIIMFFALIAAFYDERRDHSVLFWKSMPVGDLRTVAAKFVFVAWVAPLATILAIFAAQVLATTMASLYVEDGAGARIWSASSIWFRPLELVFAYLMNGLWAMPLIAWVLLVSAWASRAPILWALGVPLLLNVLERLFFGTQHLSGAIATHLANPSFLHGRIEHGHLIVVDMSDRFGFLAMPGFWAGLVVGTGLLATTVYLRRHYNEI